MGELPVWRAAEQAKEIVARHAVHWEVWPEIEIYQGKRRQSGLRVELHGTHHRPAHVPSPGCDECERVYLALARVSRAVMPASCPGVHVQVEPFDRELHFPPGGRPDKVVLLVIRLLFQGSGEAALTCLRSIEAALRLLGATPGTRNLGDASPRGSRYGS